VIDDDDDVTSAASVYEMPTMRPRGTGDAIALCSAVTAGDSSARLDDDDDDEPLDVATLSADVDAPLLSANTGEVACATSTNIDTPSASAPAHTASVSALSAFNTAGVNSDPMVLDLF
jgi:hypothetical protein